MLDKLALKHSTWVKFAYQICKDTYLADDLVSEMYLKLSNEVKELNDWYIYFAIKHIYINWVRQENKFVELKDCYYSNEEIEFKKIDIDLPNNLTWVEKQILLLRQEMSCREIEKQYHISYLKIHRIEKQAKEKAKEWAIKKYQELVMQ